MFRQERYKLTGALTFMRWAQSVEATIVAAFSHRNFDLLTSELACVWFLLH